MQDLNKEEVISEGIIPQDEIVKPVYKNIKIVLPTMLLIIALLVSVFLFFTNKNDNPTLLNQQVSLTFNDEGIYLSGEILLHIDAFPDNVIVAEEGYGFGSSDKIAEAVLSTDKKKIAIAVSGAAHDFGWIYDIDSMELVNVAFSYGGDVTIDRWEGDKLFLLIGSPKPSVSEQVIELNSIPEFRTRANITDPYNSTIVYSDMLNYRNDEYGFKIEIPEGMNYSTEYTKQDYIGSDKKWYVINFNSPDETKGLTIEVDPDGYGPLYSNLAYEIAVEEGGLVYERSIQKEQGYPWRGEIRTNTYLRFEANGHDFLVSYYSHNTAPEVEKSSIEKMIDSFIFVDQVSKHDDSIRVIQDLIYEVEKETGVLLASKESLMRGFIDNLATIEIDVKGIDYNFHEYFLSNGFEKNALVTEAVASYNKADVLCQIANYYSGENLVYCADYDIRLFFE